ncbi:hypothetical protein OKW46_000736 [Paraburkholderia sp. WSM4179]|nr:hypothetical protein [Paraburkholderia sp. WSM4179]
METKGAPKHRVLEGTNDLTFLAFWVPESVLLLKT